ncbi:hydrolase related to dienelactone hydrolase [Fusarium heterosporum]|uniref:Hydrolase related to dienelactone hydrolase n=1 Tax=Fusarium heterosporum TaxID=42747 RepID=A0A8H5WVR9_FUSHE|nr:hydrolase related to dienelactone hydrolase [Fusarium heterosporum]
MASHPPAACCTIVSLHEGTPKGTSIVIENNVSAYLAKPSSGDLTKAILYLPDIFGIWQNSMLMADAFATEGYVCLVVDTFNGDPVPLEMPKDFDIMKWLKEGSNGVNPHTPEAVDPIIVSGIEYLRSIGVTEIGAVGYCLGAKHLVRHYKSGIQVGFMAHPSFVETEELAAITGPLSVAAAELDDLFTTKKRHESEAILSESKRDFQINLFSGVHHGFAVKGDLNDKKQLFAKEQAFAQAVAWFKRYFH